MRANVLLLGVFALACAAPAAEKEAVPAPADPAVVRQTIEAANARQAAAMAAGDAAGATANYADGAVFMMSGAPAARGKAAVTELFAGMMQQLTVSDITLRTEDVVVSGDLAVEHGSYKWTMTPKGAKPMPDSGKYVVAWQKQADGSWKIIRDIANTDIAPPM